MLRVTVALYVKVFDGIVLATDSATTFAVPRLKIGIPPIEYVHRFTTTRTRSFTSIGSCPSLL
jgi:hypothetical protein